MNLIIIVQEVTVFFFTLSINVFWPYKTNLLILQRPNARLRVVMAVWMIQILLDMTPRLPVNWQYYGLFGGTSCSHS